MAETPPISYRKPTPTSIQTKSLPSSKLSSPFASPALSETPQSDSKNHPFLSRRKALQDFYSINEPESSQGDSGRGQDFDTSNLSSGIEKFTNNGTDEYLDLPIEEILKLRNSISFTLNSYDLTQKSLIYDNYHELISLSNTLRDFSLPRPQKSKPQLLESFGISVPSDGEEKSEKETSGDFIEDTLTDLRSFVGSKVKRFSSDFESLIQGLQQEFKEGSEADSSASVESIKENQEQDNLPDSLDKNMFVKELNSLLQNDKNMAAEKKEKYVSDIQNCLSELDIHKDELLIIELNEIKKVLRNEN